MKNTAPPPAAPPLPPSTLAQAAGYGTQAAPPRRGRLALAAIGGAALAAAIAIAIAVAARPGSAPAPSSAGSSPLAPGTGLQPIGSHGRVMAWE